MKRTDTLADADRGLLAAIEPYEAGVWAKRLGIDVLSLRSQAQQQAPGRIDGWRARHAWR